MDDLISRAEAIKEIEGLVATMSVCLSREECNGMRSMKERAINAVNELPTAEPSTTLMKVEVGVDKESLRKAMEEAELTFVAEPRKGRWKISDLPKGQMKYCSECGFGQYIADVRTYHYCPNCGARMEE